MRSRHYIHIRRRKRFFCIVLYKYDERGFSGFFLTCMGSSFLKGFISSMQRESMVTVLVFQWSVLHFARFCKLLDS